MILLPLSRQPQSVAIALMPRQGLTTAHWQAGRRATCFLIHFQFQVPILMLHLTGDLLPGAPQLWHLSDLISNANHHFTSPARAWARAQTRCSVSLEWRQQKYRAFPTMDGRRRSLVSVRIGSARYRSREKKSSVEIQTIPTAWQRGNTTGIKELSLCLTALVSRRQDSGGAYRLLYDGGNPFSILRHQISSRRVCKALRQP